MTKMGVQNVERTTFYIPQATFNLLHMGHIITAIDIGTTAISAIVAEKQKDGGIRVLGVAQSPTFGMRKGTVADIDEVVASLKKCVEDASKSSGVRVRRAVVGVSGPHIHTSNVRGVVAISRADGEIVHEDVQRVIQAAENSMPKNPNREIIHIVPREYTIDSEDGIKDPVGMSGIRLEVDAMVVDGSKSSLKAIVKCIEGAGLEIDDFVFSSLASAEAVLSRRQKELGVMLLDIGGGTSDFSVWEEGRLIHAGVFSVGGTHITHDIAVGLQVHVDMAEKIKLEFGHSLPETFSKKETIKLADLGLNDQSVFLKRHIAEIIEARLKDILELAAKELKRIDRSGLLPAGVVLIGGASRIPGIEEIAKKELKLPIEVGKTVNLPHEADKGLQELLFAYPVALGLIAWQVNKASGDNPYFYNATFTLVASKVKNWLRVFIP